MWMTQGKITENKPETTWDTSQAGPSSIELGWEQMSTVSDRGQWTMTHGPNLAHCLVSWIQFYRNPAVPIHLSTFYGCFCTEWRSCTIDSVAHVHWEKKCTKVENYILFGRLTENLSLGGSLSDSSETLLQRGKGELEYIGIFATETK